MLTRISDSYSRFFSLLNVAEIGIVRQVRMAAPHKSVCNFMQTEVVIINQRQQKSHDIEISILAATTVRPQNNLIVSLAILSNKFL